MVSRQQTAVVTVVDGYSAGNFYPAAFADSGAALIHVQSTPELIPTMLAPDLGRYAENIVMTGEPNAEAKVLDRLRHLRPTCVIPGQESAVLLADRLSEALGVPTNGTRCSPARRDKYAMIETLRAAGLRCADQVKTSDPAVAVGWAESNGYPVVVKPLSSAATDGVQVCQDSGQVRDAAEAVLSGRDIFDFANDEVLVQSYLPGIEYIVDTVSSDGLRYACGVWQYEKDLLPSGRNIYDKDILVDPDGVVAETLIAYVDDVLRALDIRWGPAHAEVIVTPEGPALVEIGARLNGNLDPGFHDVCVGNNQAAVTALAYLDPGRFRRELGGRRYRRLQPAVVYNAPTVLDGVVESIDDETVTRLRELESAHVVAVKLKPGARIRPTVDLLTSPLRVFLTAPDDDQLMADYAEARRLKDAVYRVAARTT
jgi:hypothetical protein